MPTVRGEPTQAEEKRAREIEACYRQRELELRRLDRRAGRVAPEQPVEAVEDFDPETKP